jgi:hypothetical protein
MQKRWVFYLLFLISSYLILIKLNLDSLVQPIRILITFIIALESVVYLLKRQSRLITLPSYRTGLFAIYIVITIFAFPMNWAFNMGSTVKYSCYLLVFLAAYNGFYIQSEKLFSKYFLFSLYGVSFFQLFTGDTEFINMVERVSGLYYRHSSGMALILTILIGHVLYKSRSNWKYLHLITISYLLLKTGSRSGVIAAIFAWLFIEVFKRKDWKVFVLFLSLSIVSSYYLLDILSRFSLFERFVYLIDNGSDASTLNRLEYFKNATREMSVSLFGNGFGSFAVQYEELYGKRLGAHNNMLLFLIELGYLGVILYCIHLLVLFLGIIKLNNLYLLFLFIAFYVGGSLNNNYYYPVGMIIFFIELGKSLSNGERHIT